MVLKNFNGDHLTKGNVLRRNWDYRFPVKIFTPRFITRIILVRICIIGLMHSTNSRDNRFVSWPIQLWWWYVSKIWLKFYFCSEMVCAVVRPPCLFRLVGNFLVLLSSSLFALRECDLKAYSHCVWIENLLRCLKSVWKLRWLFSEPIC